MNTYEKFMEVYDRLVSERDSALISYIQNPCDKTKSDFELISRDFWELMVSIQNDLEKGDI